MNHTLDIQLSGREGAVVRTLGLIERRGYSLDTCSVSSADESGQGMQVTVRSTRPGDLLKRQLERLHDVFYVELKPVEPIKPHSPGVRPITRRT